MTPPPDEDLGDDSAVFEEPLVEESEFPEEWQEGVVHDEFDSAFDEHQEPLFEGEGDEALEEPVIEEATITRKEDLHLDEVEEHLREAVEGSLKMKKILEATDDGHDAKRRKLGRAASNEEDTMKRESHPEKTELLRELKLQDNLVCRYVVESAELEEIQELRKSQFAIKKNHKKTAGEQLSDQLIHVRELHGPHGSMIDASSAFVIRYHLTQEHEKMLRTLSHKELRYVISVYDETASLSDVVEDAKVCGAVSEPSPAALDRPGALTLGRFNRLELIAPDCNALVVGDANLTFSLVLAQHRRDLGHSGQTVVTTFELLPTLRERYTEIDETIKQLQELGAEVLHNVDCTRLGVDTRFVDKEAKFGAVYYNFPHAGAVNGFFDGHPLVRWRHENLMHLFFRALRSFVSPGGSVKVSSNCGARGVRFSDITGAANTNEFMHVETVPFTEWTLRDYNRSYGDKRDKKKRPKKGEIYAAQNASRDMIYCFCYAPSGLDVPKLRVRYPPTKYDLMNCDEGALQGLHGDQKQAKVDELTTLFLTYIQGIHVG